MLVVTEGQLADLIQKIVSTAHNSTDLEGNRAKLPTMEQSALRTAALAALLVATGHIVGTTRG